jgi:hypothetical protein
MVVMIGEKRITLYPPSDTPYLKPYSILPFWATNDPVQFEYNNYIFIKILINFFIKLINESKI